MVKVNLLSALMIISFAEVYAQDMVYYNKNKPDAWRVTEITPTYIKAVDAKDPEIAYSTTPENVLFVFSKNGNFLSVPELSESKAGYESAVRAFFTETKTRFNELDKIITNKYEIITCTYESTGKSAITYSVAGKKQDIALSKVAAIIFKNGSHKLLGPPAKISKVLGVVQDQYYKLASSQPKLTDKKDSLTARVDTTKKAASDTSSKNTKAIPGASQAAVTELEPSTVLKLQNKALINIKQLGDYVQIICQTDTDPDELSKTVEQAVALFINDARIEVSSVNRDNVNQFKIKDYLVRLGYLKYQKVIIEWYNIQYTSLLRKGPDGFYYGTIEFEQRFVGISADKVKYEDITRKSVEVVLKTYERHSGGQTTLEWDVFLGDIGVTVTKAAS